MEALKKNIKKKFTVSFAKKLIGSLVFIFLFELIGFSAPALASSSDNSLSTSQSPLIINGVSYYNIDDSPYIDPLSIDEESGNHLPKNSYIPAQENGIHSISAYNSEAAQTDASPCTTANGFNVCKHGVEDTIAANFLKFGTKVKIPSLFGDRIFVVRDRMNRRYTERVDVWMVDKIDAIRFGVKIAKIEVINEP